MYGRNRGSGEVFSIVAMVIILLVIGLSSCNQNAMTKSWGGEMDLTLEPNQKLVQITWKDTDLWILTKDMSESDVAEKYTFYEESGLGIMEGEIRISEVKMSDEELAAFEEQKVLEKDYYNASNYEADGTTVKFIQYNEETEQFEMIQEYTYTEDGSLVEK